MSATGSRDFLFGTALAYAASTTLGSYVSIRDNIPGEPLAITVPLSVPTALVIGWGAGIAPPWFMPVTALLAARQACDGRPGPAALACAIGMASVVGHLIEPVTRRPGTWTFAMTTAISLGLTTSAALTMAGYARYSSTRPRRALAACG